MRYLPEPNLQEGNLRGLEPLIRRVVASRVSDPHTVEDIVQEALTRLLEARPRLTDDALVPYAIVTARNLVVSHARTEDRRRRHATRLVDLRVPERPEDQVLEQEERQAVAAALERLPAQERHTVLAHEVEGVDTATLAEELSSTPGGVAARLARARAKLRVEYLLSMQGSQPPTQKCRPVLFALSSGDRRRQSALDAGGHLLDCGHCAALSKPLLERSRALSASVPFMAASRAITRIRSFTTANPVGTGLGAAVVTVAAVIAVSMMGGEAEHPQAIPPAPRLSAGGRPVLRFTSDLGRYRGELVRARGVAVESVPADEGFWIGAGPTRRVWVKIRKVGESPLTVKPGQWVSFSGEMAAHSARFARRVGVSPSEGAAQLTRQAHHIDVNERDLQITRADLPGRRRVS